MKTTPRPASPKRRSSVARPRRRPLVGDVVGVLFDGANRPISRRRLHRLVDPLVESWIAATCRWTGPHPRDEHRFVIFSIDVARRTQVYIQLWSEPGDPVLCEVSSGRWNPPADRWLAGARSKRIAAHGFSIGGEAENFQREFRVRTARQAKALAETIVDVMYDGFDYRGALPIDVRYSGDVRHVLAHLEPDSPRR